MRIVNAGYNYRHLPDFTINRPYGSGDYLFLIIKTEAFVYLSGQKITVPQNSAIIFKKGTPQHYGANLSEYVNDWIHFDIDEPEEKFISALKIPFDTILPLPEISELSAFVKSIFFELYSQNVYKNESMQKYFELIMLKLSESQRGRNTEHGHPYYDTFCKLRSEIQLTPQNHRSIDDIAKKLNISRSYLQHLYKRFYGTGIVSDIQKYRIEHAKYLLSATAMTVSAISQSSGYDSDVHFMRTFKKVTGMTPSNFRGKFCLSGDEIKESKQRPPFSI